MHRRLASGFTWPELLTVLAITGVLAGLALPALSDAVARRRLDTTAEALMTALAQARAAAVRRGHPTTVCASANGRACSPLADWTRGWIGRDDHQETVFEAMGPLDDTLAMTGRGGHARVTFHDNGTTPGRNQTVTLCVRGKRGTAVSVIIANSGLARRAPAASTDAASCAAMSASKR